jgi:hypothetical protein
MGARPGAGTQTGAPMSAGVSWLSLDWVFWQRDFRN